MILDIKNMSEELKALYPCKIMDVHGKEIQNVVYCNTVTGYVIRLLTDEKGNFLVDAAQPNEVAREARIYDSPLKIERIIQ